ncbi:hypothetical protein OSTOST_24552 [Ostertagia ostertagi]
MEELNSLSFERLQFVSDYYKLVIQLENYLSSARSDISKARTLQGVALSSIFKPPFNDGKFTLVDGVEASSGDESESKVRKRKEGEAPKKEQKDDKPKVKHIPNFRRVRVSEPSIVCELATLQCEIKRIDSRMLSIKESLKLDGELSEKLEHILKV